MSTLLTFATLGLLVVAGGWFVAAARRYATGIDDRRHSLETLAGLCESSYLDADEARRVKAAIESRLQKI